MIVAIDEGDTHTSISNYRLVDNATHSQRVTPIAFRRSRHWCHCDHQKGKLATLSLMKEPDSIKSWRTQTDGEKEDKAGHTDHVHIHLCVCIAAVALATVVTVHQERERESRRRQSSRRATCQELRQWSNRRHQPSAKKRGWLGSEKGWESFFCFFLQHTMLMVSSTCPLIETV